MGTERAPSRIADYVAALIQSAAQISAIIEQMERFARRGGPRTRPTIAVLSELVEGILTDPEAEVDLKEIDRATQLLLEATVAIAENLFFVDPDAMGDEGGIDSAS